MKNLRLPKQFSGRTLAVAALTAASIASPALADPTEAANARGILKCVRDNVPEAISIRNITVTTTDRSGGVNEIKARVYAKREVDASGLGKMRANLTIEAPENLAGTSYLMRETDDYLRDAMFVYLPGIGRVRRISGEFAEGSLMGSDFTYYEFKQIENAFSDLNPRLVKGESISGRPAYVLEFVPMPGTETGYSSVQTWIDRDHCVLLAAEFYQGDTALKRLTAAVDTITKTGDRWYIGKMTMQNLRTETQTTLTVDEVTVDANLSSRVFNPSSFYRTK